MRNIPIASILILVLICPAGAVNGGDLPKAVREGIDAAVADAYRAASAGLPCRIKGRGKPKRFRWEEVDRCLNEAVSRVDWAALSATLEGIRAANKSVTETEFIASVEASISAGALAFDKVFTTKDEGILVPLTNSLLKFLPPDSLVGLAVTDKAGTQVGTFAGTYSYDRSGGLATANQFRLTLFQYTDRSGNVQAASGRLLLDTYGVPWEEARSQPGFRLPAEKLTLSR